MIGLVILTIGFLALSGVMAMVDAAVLSVSRAEIEEMVTQGKRGSHALRALHQRLPRAVAVIVILTNTVNILGPILVGQRAVALFGSTIIGVITAVLTFATIVFSEVIPKSVGAHYAPRIARHAAQPILVIATVLFPLVWLLEVITGFFRSGRRVIGTEEQIRALVRIGHHAGHIESDEGQMIHRAFILNDKLAGQVMTPLEDMVSLPQTATIRGAAQIVFRNTYSRYPVFGSSVHDVRGIVISHDVLEALAKGRDRDRVTTVLREPLFVESTLPCDDLLVLFRDRNIHLAIVREQGRTLGLVTLEDVLEELVGEIEDEKDVEEG